MVDRNSRHSGIPDEIGSPERRLPGAKQVARAAASGGRLKQLYRGLWLALGMSSVAYIGSIVLIPASVDRLAAQMFSASGPSETTVKLAAFDQRHKTQATEIAKLNTSIAALEQTLSKISQQREQLALRIARVESGKPMTADEVLAMTQRLDPDPALFQPEDTDIDGLVGVTVDGDAVTAMEPAATPAAAKAKKAAASNGTGEPAAPVDAKFDPEELSAAEPVPAPAPKPKAEKKAVGVELVVGESPNDMQTQWEALHDQYPELLGSATPRVTAAENGVSLLAGPFPSGAKAEKVCARLALDGLHCRVAPYTGEPL